MLTEPFSANFNVFAHGIWFLCLHHLLFNIRTHSSHLYACVVSSNFFGEKSIYLYFCHVSKYLHCCRLSRQWILFKENPYSFLACGAADSFCFFLGNILILPGWSSGHGSLLQGLESEIFIPVASCPSLTPAQPLLWQCCCQTAPVQLQLLTAALLGLTLHIYLLKGSIWYPLPLQEKPDWHVQQTQYCFSPCLCYCLWLLPSSGSRE